MKQKQDGWRARKVRIEFKTEFKTSFKPKFENKFKRKSTGKIAVLPVRSAMDFSASRC
jgi:hypothetical protein